MVCRDRKISSAIITFARDMSGLDDSQVRALHHSLMREEQARPVASRPHGETLEHEHKRLVNKLEKDYESGELTLTPGSHNPAARFRVARSEPPEARRLYAAERIVERAKRAAAAHSQFLHQYAQDLGVSVTHAEAEFSSAFDTATEDPLTQPSPAFVKAWENNPDHTDLPVDRRSVYAYEQMEISRANIKMRSETRRSVTRTPITSDLIQEIGYDPVNGHVEMVTEEHPDRVYAYRMSAIEYQNFIAAESHKEYYWTHIRGNKAYQYGTQAEAIEGSIHRRCMTCQQFVGTGHLCPVVGSEDSLNRDYRIAVRKARQLAAGHDPTEDPVTTTLQLRGTTRYPLPNGSVRVPGITRIQQETRREGIVDVEVVANISSATVSGHVTVEYNGRGNGYTVTPVTDTPNSNARSLQCTCRDYRKNYRCAHITETVTTITNLTNPVPARPVPFAGPDLPAPPPKWEPLDMPLTEDPDMFQIMHDEATMDIEEYRTAIKNGIPAAELAHPVPFITEKGALGGMCTRESGQGIAPEIEYSFPEHWTEEQVRAANRAIGEELHAAGLTETPEQQPHGHAQTLPPRYEHARGWCFEHDPSTGGTAPGVPRNGGEIVPPIMYDEPETWENLETVCTIIKKHGGIASPKSSTHVHVGVSHYGTSVAAYNRLLDAFAENEDILYRLHANPDTGKHRIHKHPMHCSPNPRPSSPYTTFGEARADNSWKDFAVNLEPVTGKRDGHVEFRIGDSSLQPGVIQTQMLIAAALVNGAAREAEQQSPTGIRTPLGTHAQEHTTDRDSDQDTLVFRSFVDRYIPGGGPDGGQERVQQLVTLYAMTTWQTAPTLATETAA